jgi:hypothetical protein
MRLRTALALSKKIVRNVRAAMPFIQYSNVKPLKNCISLADLVVFEETDYSKKSLTVMQLLKLQFLANY